MGDSNIFLIHIASLSAFTVGIDFGWSSHALPKLQRPGQSIFITNSEGALLISIGLFVGLFSFPITAFLFDRIGRKLTLLLTAIPHFLAWMCLGFGNSKEWIFLGRVFSGIANAGVLITIPFYISEISHPSIRGRLSAMFTIFYNAGIISSYAVGPFVSFKAFARIAAVVPPLFFILFSYMPESPTFLLMHQRIEEAKKAQIRLNGNIDSNFEGSVDMGQKEKQSIIKVICENKRGILIVLMMTTIEQFSGITVLLFYCQTMFMKAGGSLSADVSAIIFAAVFLCGSLSTSLVVDILGRRKLSFISCTGAGIFLFLQGTYLFLKDKTTIDLSSAQWLPILFILPYVFVNAIGLVNLPMILMGELLPASMKAIGSVIFGVYISLIIITAANFYQITSDVFGQWVPFYCFSACCLCGLVGCYLFLPETKCKTLEEIQLNLMGKSKRESKDGEGDA